MKLKYGECLRTPRDARVGHGMGDLDEFQRKKNAKSVVCNCFTFHTLIMIQIMNAWLLNILVNLKTFLV